MRNSLGDARRARDAESRATSNDRYAICNSRWSFESGSDGLGRGRWRVFWRATHRASRLNDRSSKSDWKRQSYEEITKPKSILSRGSPRVESRVSLVSDVVTTHRWVWRQRHTCASVRVLTVAHGIPNRDPVVGGRRSAFRKPSPTSAVFGVSVVLVLAHAASVCRRWCGAAWACTAASRAASAAETPRRPCLGAGN